MNYQSALDFLQKSAILGSKPGLERLKELLILCHHPEEHLKFIHVAGTNGKGSTSMMISSILSRAGYKIGLFTSPCLENVNEQIRINGEIISNEEFSKACGVIAKACEQMKEDDQPTEFELLTAIALVHFSSKECDLVVLEAGMGGSLDATNVITKCEVAVITNIGMEHMQYLGNTIEKIAGHKAGIIKRDSYTVCYQLEPKAAKVIHSACRNNTSILTVADFSKISVEEEHLSMQKFSYKDWSDLSLPLIGEHQRKNAAVALETITVLNSLGYRIPKEAVSQGLFHVNWPARFEVLFKKPLVILDGGHNPQCVKEAVKVLDQYVPNKKVIFVMGVMQDKNYREMIQLLAPKAKEFFTVAPRNPRALSAVTLAAAIHDCGIKATPTDEVEEGVMEALNYAKSDDVICIIGSLYMASDIKACFN